MAETVDETSPIATVARALWRKVAAAFAPPEPPPLTAAQREAALARFPEVDGYPAVEAEGFWRHYRDLFFRLRFETRDDLAYDDDMRVAVCGTAAKMARALPLGIFGRLHRVVLAREIPGGPGAHILGTANPDGVITLVWSSAQRGLQNPFDGRDVVLHELAHMIDSADGRIDGVPAAALGEHHAFAHALAIAYDVHSSKAHRGLRTRAVLREYAATHPAEFFAVASEAFFEKPDQLARRQPRVFALMKKTYRIDPRRRRKRR